MLATLIGTRRGLDVLVYSRGEQRGATAEILAATGARYADSESTPLDEAVAGFGAPDLALEATGYSPFAWQAAEVIARNGVVCLLSVTGGTRTVEIASDRLNHGLVLGNRAIVGSVSAGRIDFEDGIGALQTLRERWPAALDGFISHRTGLDGVARLLREPPADELKTVVDVARADA
jgi:threonine dehydrogenase-like Zn-dependent dehydrogenase